MHLCGLALFLFLLPADARRRNSIDDSRDYAQQQDNMLANRLKVVAGAREALVPGVFRPRFFHRAGPQAGALREGSKQDGRNVVNTDPDGSSSHLRGESRLQLPEDPLRSPSTSSPIETVRNALGFSKGIREFQKAKADGFGTRARNAAFNATVGDIMVPLCSNLEQRQKLANQGIYAGVEYEICSLQLTADSDDDTEPTRMVQTLQGLDRPTKQGAIALVKPAYPLRAHLERDDWPVPVALLEDVPLWLAKATYEAGTAVGTLAVSLSGLIMASLVAFWIQLVGVPTPSMLPALPPGTVVLVTRSLPMLGKAFQPKVGDVVFFDAPSELETIISQRMVKESPSGSEDINDVMANFVPSTSDKTAATATTKGKQLLKRVVAVPNEKVGVKQSSPLVQVSDTKFRLDVIGPYSRPEVFSADSWNRPPQTLGNNEYFVAGDNGYRSVDSRVWGPLQQKYLIGTAQWVVWPLDQFGPIPPGPISEVTKPTSST